MRCTIPRGGARRRSGGSVGLGRSAKSRRAGIWSGANAIASSHALPDRSLRPDLAAARAVLHLDLHEPAQPGVRELGRPADRLLPAAMDHAGLRDHVGLVKPRLWLRVVHRRPWLLLRPRVLLASRAPPATGRTRLIRIPGGSPPNPGATVTKADRRRCRDGGHDLGT